MYRVCDNGMTFYTSGQENINAAEIFDDDWLDFFDEDALDRFDGYNTCIDKSDEASNLQNFEYGVYQYHGVSREIL